MTFGQSIQTCFQKYVEFSGRASRSEFWYFMLFQLLVNVAAGELGGSAGGLVWLALLLPSVAVNVRRLQDQGRSGWWCLLYFLPVVGFIILVIWNAQRGTVGPNQYGADPVV
jgi:uncharacterized membrane protein YhaH (DUF805 family)